MNTGKDKELSPMMKQYKEIKKKHPDSILLFRCGDFYETYDVDASIASRILGITLTRRTSDNLNMAGFPYHALDTYLPKLIRAGKRVGICDQIEDPKDKKTVKRVVTEVISPTKESDNNNTKPEKTEEEMNKEQENAIRAEYEKQIAELKEESRVKMLDIAKAVIESYGRVDEIPENIDNALACAIGRISLINIKHFGFGHVLNDSDIEYLIDTAKKAVDANL